MKILFIVPYSSEGASSRYRVEQYLPYLRREGIGYDIRPFAFEKFYKILYVKGKYFIKIFYFVIALLNRIFDIVRLYRYDVVFIHREACPIGPPVFEWLVYKFKKQIIFDFDDAIFLQNYNPINSIYKILKLPSKTNSIIKMAQTVIVANKFLEEYAFRFNKNVYVIATPIDTDKFNISKRNNSGRLTIGWIGSPTTAVYLKIIYGAMQSLGRKYDFIFKIVGADQNIYIPGVVVENQEWQIDREISDFQSIDIGIYPLPDTLWAKGKAGFKAIQYMACGIPVIASPVGITKEIICDGTNGFLAQDENDWISKMSRLIENSDLRINIGLEGRKTVEEKFALRINSPKYMEIIKSYKT